MEDGEMPQEIFNNVVALTKTDDHRAGQLGAVLNEYVKRKRGLNAEPGAKVHRFAFDC
jgi:hypothetical protein